MSTSTRRIRRLRRAAKHARDVAAPGGDPGAATAIRTRRLTKVYRNGMRAVGGIDLEVRPGEFFGLLGPNGAGKTTTIGMLTTRVVPTAGEASVAGVDVTAHPARAKRQIGVVPQTNTLDRSISVEENLYYHGRYFGMPRRVSRRRSRELLERFRLADRAGALVGTLSGGMAQRLMVARALMHHPAVLFLDEPTSGLDPQSRIALWDLLRGENRHGQTILLTTHYMEEAERLCDRVAIMDHGRILALDTPGGLKLAVEADAQVHIAIEPADGEEAERLERLAGAVAALPGVSSADVRDGVVRVHTGVVRGLLPRLVAAAERQHVRLSDLEVREPTLESVFIALTGRELRE